jgi:hypothetical protein
MLPHILNIRFFGNSMTGKMIHMITKVHRQTPLRLPCPGDRPGTGLAGNQTGSLKEAVTALHRIVILEGLTGFPER